MIQFILNFDIKYVVDMFMNKINKIISLKKLVHVKHIVCQKKIHIFKSNF